MRIKKTFKNNVLLEQKIILSNYPDSHKSIVLFRDKEMLEIVLGDTLNGFIKSFLTQYRVYNSFIEEYIRQNTDVFKICYISRILSDSFNWMLTNEGFVFWDIINKKFQMLTNNIYEDQKKHFKYII